MGMTERKLTSYKNQREVAEFIYSLPPDEQRIVAQVQERVIERFIHGEDMPIETFEVHGRALSAMAVHSQLYDDGIGVTMLGLACFEYILADVNEEFRTKGRELRIQRIK
jgi:hypothetical protein